MTRPEARAHQKRRRPNMAARDKATGRVRSPGFNGLSWPKGEPTPKHVTPKRPYVTKGKTGIVPAKTLRRRERKRLAAQK